MRYSRYYKARSARGSRMAKARWDADRARRQNEEPERLRELAKIHAANLPHQPGDILGMLQWTDAATGRVRRWTIRIGARRDQITAETPDGRRSKSMGWSRLLTAIRPYLCERKS